MPPDATPLTAPAGPPGDTRYVPELDGMRGLAVLSLLCLHWLGRAGGLNRLQGQTTNGVHLFFVLSGFLITRGLLQSRQAMDARQASLGWVVGHFFARRALRIVPVYYLLLAVMAALSLVGRRQAIEWHATFLSNVYYCLRRGQFDGPASVFWTLGVEEQFYLLWPLAILLLPRRALVPFIAAVALAGTAVRVVAIGRFPPGEMLMPTCANFLAVGALVATVNNPTFGSAVAARRTRMAFRVVVVAAVAANLVLLAVRGPTYMTFAAAVRMVNQPLASVVYAVVIARAVGGRAVPVVSCALRWGPLARLGEISYGVYPFHLFVAALWERATHAPLVPLHGEPQPPAVAACFGLTVTLAAASWYGFERPISNLKRYFSAVPRSESAMLP